MKRRPNVSPATKRLLQVIVALLIFVAGCIYVFEYQWYQSNQELEKDTKNFQRLRGDRRHEHAIHRQKRRRQQSDVCGVTSFFNPAGFASKTKNYRRFSKRIRKQGLFLVLVELAFDDRPFALGNGTETADLVSVAV